MAKITSGNNATVAVPIGCTVLLHDTGGLVRFEFPVGTTLHEGGGNDKSFGPFSTTDNCRITSVSGDMEYEVVSPSVPAESRVQVLAKSAVAVSCPVNTTENILATIPVPAGAMGPNGYLRIYTLWSFNNNANAKTCTIHFGGVAGTQYLAFPVASSLQFSDLRMIANRGVVTSQIGATNGVNGGLGASTGGVITSSVDTSAATTIVITGTKAIAGDTQTLEFYLVELVYGA